MKKFGLLLFIILLLPVVVNAEGKNVTVKEISLYDKSDNVVEENPAVIVDGKISLDFKMYEVGDYIQYKLKVVNNSNETLEIDKNSININDDYVKYSLFFQNSDNSIKSGEEKLVYLKISYTNKVADKDFFSAKYINQGKIALRITSPSIVNPETIRTILPILLLIEIMIGYSVYSKRKLKYSKVIILLLCIGLIPFSVSALKEEIIVDQKTTIRKIKPTHCTYSGELVKGAEYTNGQFTYRYMQEIIAREEEGEYIPEWHDIDTEGWGVVLSDKASTEDVTSTMCSTINDKPLVSTSGVFYGSQTSNIDTSRMDTENVTNMYGMFAGILNLEELDASNLDTSKVTNMYGMFTFDSNLRELDLSTFDTSNVTNMLGIFWKCRNLISLDVSNFNTSKVIDLSGAFSDCNSLTSLDLSSFDTSKVTNMGFMFENCNRLTSLDLRKWDVSNVVEISNMFSNCRSLTSLNLSGWNISAVEDIRSIFYGSSNLKTLNLKDWNTSNTTDLSYLFDGLSNLENLDVSGWDTSHVDDMSWMFSECSSLKRVDLKDWDTSNLEYAYMMFNECSGFESLDLSTFNMSKAIDIYGMFTNCSHLKSIDLSSWNTSNVSNMSHMFDGCTSLTSLDLSSFDTSGISNMYYMYDMFAGCTSLITAYGRTQADCDRFNSSYDKPANVNFVVKV